MEGRLTEEVLCQIAVKRIENYSNADTVVFLHDSLGCIDLWRDFPQQFSEINQCNVLVYDRQGYGKSLPFGNGERDQKYMENEADFLVELLNFWNIETPILFGHSDGGSIALIAAGKYPNLIKAVITEGAHVFVEDITLEGINDAIKLYEESQLPSKLEKYHGAKTNEMFWAWAKTWNQSFFRNWNIEHFLPSITCPCLIIQGENDEYGTLEQVNKILKGISGLGQQLVLPNVKHTPHKELPETVLENCATFIQEI